MPLPRLNTLPVPVAMEWIGGHIEEQERAGMEIAEEVRALTSAIEKLSDRVAAHDKRKAWWDKLVMSVATAIAIALVFGAYHVAMIVQSNRLPTIPGQ